MRSASETMVFYDRESRRQLVFRTNHLLPLSAVADIKESGAISSVPFIKNGNEPSSDGIVLGEWFRYGAM